MKKLNRNIYMGPKSTAKIPIFGKVDTCPEICLNVIATAYDALNDIMLTRQSGVYTKTNPATINGRFTVLKGLAKKYAPDRLIVINQIQKIVMDNYHGKISYNDALNKIKMVYDRNNIDPGLLNTAIFHINQAEVLQKKVNHGPFVWFNQQKTPLRKRRRVR